jgi:hypothetical protein
MWPSRPQSEVRQLGAHCHRLLRQAPRGDDRNSASVTHRIEEMCRCHFTNDFANLSATSATDHPRGTRRQPCRPLLPDVPPMSRHARLQRPRMLGAMATLTGRRRAGGWMISRLPRDKSSSVLVAIATVTGLANWRAVRSRCRVLSASASADPPDVSSGPRASIASPRTYEFGLALAATTEVVRKRHRQPLTCSQTVIWSSPLVDTRLSPLAEPSTAPCLSCSPETGSIRVVVIMDGPPLRPEFDTAIAFRLVSGGFRNAFVPTTTTCSGRRDGRCAVSW